MKILILEDDPERRKLFYQVLHHKTKVIAMVDTPNDCIRLLGSISWDIAFLDHDLGGKAYCASDDDSGYRVAEWLAINSKHMPRKVYLHSMNGAGSDNMKRALPAAEQCPFSLVISALMEESRKP